MERTTARGQAGREDYYYLGDTLTIKDRYGIKYNEIEGFEFRTRNDFTLSELEEAISQATDYWDEGSEPESAGIDFLYPENPSGGGRDESGKFIPYYDTDAAPIGYRLETLEDFTYEGGSIQGFGTFEVVHSGNLGDGHEAWVLFKHKESGRLFRLGGWYSSWDTGEMDEWVEVEPARVTVVRYKPVGKPDSEAFENPAVTL